MIELQLLGSLDLVADASPDPDRLLRQPKRVALLAYLALARPRGVHRRDALLALFWPDLDEQRARDALTAALGFVRRTLGAGVIVTRGAEEVGLAFDRVACDAVRFDDAVAAGQLSDALALYRGELLAGFHVDDAPELDDWIGRERRRLRDAAVRAARELAVQRERDGHLTLAVSSARRAAELAESDERIVRELLALLDRLGDRAGAVHAYETFARRLRAEYDAEPAAETRELAARIRAREDARAATAMPTSAPTPVLTPASATRRSSARRRAATNRRARCSHGVRRSDATRRGSCRAASHAIARSGRPMRRRCCASSTRRAGSRRRRAGRDCRSRSRRTASRSAAPSRSRGAPRRRSVFPTGRCRRRSAR